jgi:Pyrimidine dimer DNA glycosylase
VAAKPAGFRAPYGLSLSMRLWTLHPKYLDAKGLVAAWREALLAQKVLTGTTRGYRNHPQFIRFKAQPDSLAAIAALLAGLAAEAKRRGYHFDRGKILSRKSTRRIPETTGQLLFEWEHLQAKLRVRAPLVARQARALIAPEPHPLFRIVPGKRRSWEKTS